MFSVIKYMFSISSIVGDSVRGLVGGLRSFGEMVRISEGACGGGLKSKLFGPMYCLLSFNESDGFNSIRLIYLSILI